MTHYDLLFPVQRVVKVSDSIAFVFMMLGQTEHFPPYPLFYHDLMFNFEPINPSRSIVSKTTEMSQLGYCDFRKLSAQNGALSFQVHYFFSLA
jgi:hypothetical protein